MAGILGGTNSLHTNSMDETLALPTDEAVMIALRTQQVIAEESGISNVADPFGGSYFMESLTNKVERETLGYIQKIDEMGGMIAAVEKGYPQAEIANSAYHFQRQLESREKIMVGVNKYQVPDPKKKIETLYIDRSIEKTQIQRLAELRKKRPQKAYQDGIRGVRETAQAGGNLVGPIVEAVKAYATLQEVCDTLRSVYGEYREAGSF
jgi:methylmalonyl-CoA mutase N-terminal domain/subunit